MFFHVSGHLEWGGDSTRLKTLPLKHWLGFAAAKWIAKSLLMQSHPSCFRNERLYQPMLRDRVDFQVKWLFQNGPLQQAHVNLAVPLMHGPLTEASPPLWRRWRASAEPRRCCRSGTRAASTPASWSPSCPSRSRCSNPWGDAVNQVRRGGVIQWWWNLINESGWKKITGSPSPCPWSCRYSRRTSPWRAARQWRQRWTWRACRRSGCWRRSSETSPRSQTLPGKQGGGSRLSNTPTSEQWPGREKHHHLVI